MRILCLIGREVSYPRNDVILRAFRRFGKVDVISGGGSGSLIGRSLRVSLQALPHLAAKQFDLLFVGFYGHLLMLTAGILTHSPVLFDAFVSNYDTLCFDRGLFSPRSLPGRLAFWLDKTSTRLADLILLDTPQHSRYFANLFDIPPQKLDFLPVGCNEDIFYPRKNDAHEGTKVLYYSTYLPLHGVDTVVRAADLLRFESNLRFKIIGIGQEYVSVRRLSDDLGIKNINFVPSISLNRLPLEIAEADVCLGGHFGASDKAARVIPGKVYQILAMGCPLIAANTPANQDLLSHGESAILCQPNDANALASAILALHRDSVLRQRLSERGLSRFREKASEAVITQRLKSIASQLIKRP
ncbi:MAG: glycosyltransferase [Anaerolineales bacterium]|jgi:glycosyltransferase involved in cell wall biosynthesis